MVLLPAVLGRCFEIEFWERAHTCTNHLLVRPLGGPALVVSGLISTLTVVMTNSELYILYIHIYTHISISCTYIYMHIYIYMHLCIYIYISTLITL